MSRIREKLFTITVKIGNPPQVFNLIIDTGSFITWVNSIECQNCQSSRKFSPLTSKTFYNLSTEHSITYVSGNNKGYLAKEEFDLNDHKINSFGFMISTLANIDIDEMEGIIGLGRYYSMGDSFSLIESMKINNLIDKRIFSQKIFNSSYGKLYIGDLAEEIKNDMNNYTICNVNTKDKMLKKFWNCNLAIYVIGKNPNLNIIKPVGLYAIFDTGSNVILAPMPVSN